MTRTNKFLGLLMAFALAAFALPALAHSDDERFTLFVAPGAAGQLTATITNKSSDDDRIKSFKIPFPSNVSAVTVLGPPSVTTSGRYIQATSVSLAKGQSITITLGITLSPTTCTPTATAWSGSTTLVYGSTNFNGDKFSFSSSGSQLNANVTPACSTATSNQVPLNGSLGSISPASISVAPGNTATFLVTVKPGSHVSVADTCGGATPPVTSNNDTAASTSFNYTTSAAVPAGGCGVTATFTLRSYTVSATKSGSGAWQTPPTPQLVNFGQTTTFDLTPDTYSNLTGASGCGATLPTGSTTFTTGPVPVNGCTVTATYALKPVTVSPSTSGSSGSIVPPTAQTIDVGTIQIFKVKADATSHIVSVSAPLCSGTLSSTANADGSYDYTTGPAPLGGCTVTATFALNTLTITSTKTSAAKGVAFPVTASLAGGPLDASVTLTPTGCPAFTGSLTTAAVSGTATFNLTFTEVGTCSLTASSIPNYPPSTALNFVVYAVPDVGCSPSDLATSVSPGFAPLDPELDVAYTTTGWGLRNYGDVGTQTCEPVNVTLTTTLDVDGNEIANLLFDKSVTTIANFRYVIVTDPRPIPADGWPTLRPQVAWNPVGPLEYIDGLACLSDDNSLPDSVVMPLIPAGIATGTYPEGSLAKMCIAQVGWTPVVDTPGFVQYWVKVIDRSDSSVKLPR